MRTVTARDTDMANETADIMHRVRTVVDRPFATRFARAGYVTKGIIYLVVAGLAGKVALGARGETTDQSGALTALAGQTWGRGVLLVLAAGFLVYGVWNAVQVLANTQGDDQGITRVTERVGYCVLGATYIGLAIAALRLVFGGGHAPTTDDSARSLTTPLIGHWWGALLVGVAAVGILGIAVGMLFQTVTARFRDTFDTDQYPHIPAWVFWFGRIGYAALGVTSGTVGLLLLNAAWHRDANQAKGVGGALAALLARPHGITLLGAVAFGLALYGLFSFAEARYRCLDRR